MSAKHTPGPWLIEGGGKNHKSINNANGACVADVWRINIGKQEAIANTHLIAAAPELLEALQSLFGSDALQSVCIHKGSDAFGRVLGTWGFEAEQKARAALEKATGEPQ